MPLQSLLDWLFKPRDPTLVEASETVAPYKALAVAVTKKMLYEEQPSLVGVGLVYKLNYVPNVPFSAAYMHLNVWHYAASNEESENQLGEPRLLLMNISEMSDVIPVAVRHPVFLDLISQEAMGGTGEPVSPLSFRGFRLHMTWTQPPGGGGGEELTHHISFPHLLGESNLFLIEYELEKFPQSLIQGQKIAIDLKPPPKTIGTSLQTWSSLGYWRTPGSDARPSEQPKLKKRSRRRQRHLKQRHLLLGSPLNLRWEAVVRHSQQRWLPIGSMS